jgi:CheY-like chemotaxis protein
LDLRLPGVGGVELLRLLKADQQLEAVPVLICSGAGDLTRAHAKEFAAFGSEVVAKPFELDQFIDALRRTLKQDVKTA